MISMTALVRDLAGKARVVSASWNNPAAAVDEPNFIALVTRAAELLSP